MLKLNGEEVKFGHFPDGTIHLEVNDPGYADITWLYESDAEMAQLYFLVTHLHTFEIDRMVLLLHFRLFIFQLMIIMMTLFKQLHLIWMDKLFWIER